MGKLTVSINITPDGFCRHDVAIIDEEHHRFAVRLLKENDAIVFGRVTFQLFESFWPVFRDTNGSNPALQDVATLLNQKEKIVFSTTLSSSDWKPSRFINSVNKEEIDALKNSIGDILIFGSPTLVSALTALDLIDDYYFTVEPFIAGTGKRLFDNSWSHGPRKLRLIETFAFQSGVTTFHYQSETPAVNPTV